MARHTSKFKYSAAWLALFAAYLALAIVATYPLTFQATNHVFGLGTPPLNIWALSWVNRQLVQDPLSLFDGNVFFPYPRSLAFSEHLFVPSLLAAPWLAVSNNPVLAHNAVSLISLALAGVGMFLLCRELTGNNAAAFVAGMLYAFHTWNINELIRLQILSNQWFPFLLHALLRFFRHPSPRRGVWVGLTYALQSLSCMYWALYLPVPSINSIPGRQGLLGPGLSSCQCFGQHHGDREIEARPRTPRLVSHGHRVKRSELRQRDDCNNDGGRRPSEWLSRAPSKATAQVVARGHLSRAINESGRNDSSRRIRAGFA